MFSRSPDGTGQVETVLASPTGLYAEAFTPDGAQLLVRDIGTGAPNLMALSVDEEEPELRPVIEAEFMTAFSAISADGRWLAYASDETGQLEVYVRPYPDIDAGKWQISRAGGGEPRWGPDGNELFYRNGDALMVVTIDTEPAFTAGIPATLFEGDYADPVTNLPSYDVSSDGQRFLFMTDLGSQESMVEDTPLLMVENWFEELRRLAPPSQ